MFSVRVASVPPRVKRFHAAHLPGIWRTHFSRSFVFMNIAGCTFIFGNGSDELGFRSQYSGVRSWESESSPPDCADPSALVYDILSLPFVFIDIAGCTFIFEEEVSAVSTK